MSFLALRGLAKRYGTVQALAEVSLDVSAGSRTAVVGPSGSGKSTLLRLVAGFELPDAGRIALDGATLAEGAAGLPAHRRGIGVVAQDGALFPHLTVADNIGFGLDGDRAARARQVAALMERVELPAAMHGRRPHELSGGQQQRVALARALARQPRLMLLDEPFSALDAGLRESMRHAVADVLAEAGIAALLVTHDQAEALSFADQVAVLREGRLVQAGAPRALYWHPHDAATAAFLGDALILPAELADGVAECRLGRVPAKTGGRTGAATIMLRPEQLRLRAEPDGPWRVQDVRFAGAVGLATLRQAEAEIAVPCFAPDLPAPGQAMHVEVRGRAHVFAA